MEGDGATTMRKNIAAVYHDASNAGRQRTWWLGLVGQHVEQGQKKCHHKQQTCFNFDRIAKRLPE